MISSYRHLGTRIGIGLNHLPEIKARCGQAFAIYRKFRKQIFQKQAVELGEKNISLQEYGALRAGVQQWHVE